MAPRFRLTSAHVPSQPRGSASFVIEHGRENEEMGESKEEISDTDSGIILHSELQALETDLAVQRQIYEAARKLSLEENLSKPQKKSRLQQCKREEKKVKDLQEAVFQHRIKKPMQSPHQSSGQATVEYERSPIQNSPWKESKGCRGRARLPQQRCVPEIMVRCPEFSPPRPYQSSSEDSSSEHSSSSYICSPGKDRPTEIPKLCPPPYGFHFGTQKKELSCFRSLLQSTSQPQSSPGHARPTAENGPLSPQDMEMGKSFQTTPPGARNLQRGTPCQRSILKPPPPYIRLVRTPSLKDYPNHAFRLMPREIVSEELKSWHQRNQLQKFWLNCGEHQSITSPTSPHLPPFEQVGTEHTDTV
ncbi:hypothetical protein XENOCAPTIV_024807 [Xenoophorus captivus]|uniref:Cytohesin Ubiquitin Protein Inducing domain-containing protein n=1 Tax=Xenoophorus captivus TaxID=1517983 RepID=A0ABV0QXG2_9TELE